MKDLTKKENWTPKEEVGLGLAMAVFFGILILGVTFSFAPISVGLEKWNNWWWGEPKPKITYYLSNYYNKSKYSNSIKADKDCGEKAQKYFNLPITSVFSYASSTSENFSTYDCYGVKTKYTKID